MSDKIVRLGRLKPVTDEPSALPYDEANAEFKVRWDAARKAYSGLLMQAGSLAHPLFLTGGPVTRARIRTALWTAEQVAKHAQDAMAELAACADLWDRAAEYATENGGPR